MNDEFFAEFDAMFAELARRARPGGFEPNADVFLTPDGDTVLVNVELAGAEPAELRIMVEERRLYISGKRLDRDRTSRGSVLMKEIEYGDFIKKIHLPIAIAYEEASASFRDGILSIRLPVSENSLLPTARTEIRMTVRRTPV
jgi:HSP20 family protein